MGFDSDHPRARGEVGKVGVAICSLDDMETLFDGIPLAQVSTSMTINSHRGDPAGAVRRGGRTPGRRSRAKLSGTVQNDILKEYIARGTYIYPPRPAMRIVTDLFAWCRTELPELDHHLHFRLSHSRGGLDGRAGSRLHAGRRHRLRRCRHRRRAWPWTISRRGFRFSSTRTATCSKRSPSIAPRGACGRTSCANASARAIRAR